MRDVGRTSFPAAHAFTPAIITHIGQKAVPGEERRWTAVGGGRGGGTFIAGLRTRWVRLDEVGFYAPSRFFYNGVTDFCFGLAAHIQNDPLYATLLVLEARPPLHAQIFPKAGMRYHTADFQFIDQLRGDTTYSHTRSDGAVLEKYYTRKSTVKHWRCRVCGVVRLENTF